MFNPLSAFITRKLILHWLLFWHWWRYPLMSFLIVEKIMNKSIMSRHNSIIGLMVTQFLLIRSVKKSIFIFWICEKNPFNIVFYLRNSFIAFWNTPHPLQSSFSSGLILLVQGLSLFCLLPVYKDLIRTPCHAYVFFEAVNNKWYLCILILEY